MLKYERLPLWWLPIYILACGLGGGIFLSGATYWNIEYGLYAGAFGAVAGALSWLMMGIRIPTVSSRWQESYARLLEIAATYEGQRDEARERLEEARALLTQARPYVGRAPFEGSLTLEQDIEAFLYREEEVEND